MECEVKKRILLMALCILIPAFFLLDGNDASAASGEWVSDAKGWHYRYADGSYAKSEYIDGYWLNWKGNYEKKWNGTWKKSAKGWWFRAGSWYPLEQWLKIDGKSYYFDSEGYLVTNRWIGKYYVDGQGVWTKTRSSSAPLVKPKTTQLKKPSYPQGSPAALWGALQVKGTQLCSAKGEAVQLKGVSTFGIIWDEGRYNINQDAFATLKNDWGANLIRIAVYTEEYGGYCNGSDQVSTETLNKTIADAVSYATNLGMYVIIDWHILRDGNPNQHISEAKQFFADMSYQYANYDNVLYEICNEPNGGVTWNEIKKYADTIIPIIRENDGDAVILTGTPTWSQDVDQVAANPVSDKTNVMYVLHFYASTHKDWIRNKLKTAIAAGTPVFITEFSICAADGNGSIDYQSAAEWKQLIRNDNLSYAGWSLSNKNETSALIKNSSSKHSGWTEGDLSETGVWLRNLIRGN